MTFYSKIKWVLGILMVFGLIVITNLIDRKNFVMVKDSIVRIYEDRLVANDLIFNMSVSIQEKEIAVVLSDSTFFYEKNDQINEAIQGLIQQFEQTRVTFEESQLFNKLKANLKALEESERGFVESGFKSGSILANNIEDVKENLYDLSEIQLEEGRTQMSIGKKAIDSVELFTQIEIYLLVFMAIAIQVIIMYRPRKK